MKIIDLIRKKYKYDTNYQRNSDAWSLKLKRKLIDSIWNDYYIPEILIANNEVIDGKQRINAISDFMKNKFFFLDDGNKMFYEDLNEFQKNIIDNYEISVKDLGTLDDNKILNTFLRINEGSVRLSKAELLMAKATNCNRLLIKQLLVDKKIIAISNNKKKDKRFSIEELVVRIFSILNIQKTKQKGSVRSHMETIVMNDIKDEELIKGFNKTLEIMYEILGNDTIKQKSFNTLFESIFIAFYNNLEHKNSFLYNKEKLKQDIYKVQDEINAIQMGGGNKFDDFKYVKNRFEMVQKILEPYYIDEKRNFTYEQKLDIWNSNNHNCKNCKILLNNIKEFEPDHIIPHTKGGKTIISNAQILCINCNRVKSGN